MTKQEKIENLTQILTEKYGEKTFTRISIIGEERFGSKNNLKIKFLESVIEGYLKPDEIWTSDESINLLKEKIESTPDDKKEKLLLEILDTYDTKDPKIKELLRKYERYLKKFQSEVKVENLFKVSLPN